MVKWRDVPGEFRATRELLTLRAARAWGGQARGWYTADQLSRSQELWVNRHVNGGGCQAAKRFGTYYFAPCGDPPYKRSKYCWKHRRHRALWAIWRWIHDHRFPSRRSLPVPWE